MKYQLTIRTDQTDRVYTREALRELARVTDEFIERCEAAGLLTSDRMPGGGRGYTRSDVRQLARMRRLQEHLGLDLIAVEVVLHMRQRLVELLLELEEAERESLRREAALRAEIEDLRRRFASQGDWR